MRDRSVKPDEISILISQKGYHNNNAKRAFLRSLSENPSKMAKAFEIRSHPDDKTVFSGAITPWGRKWGSYWWTMDFSPITDDGTYRLYISEELSSNLFQIREDVLTFLKPDRDNKREADIIDMAMGQLDGRLTRWEEVGFKIEGVGGEYLPGYRDCGSEIRELSSHGITLHGLLDVFENGRIYHQLSRERKQDLLKKIAWTADYLVFSQEHSDNPLLNGRFSHDAVGAFGRRRTLRGIIGWHSWHDTAYAITALLRTYILARDFIPCEKYFETALRAYDNAVYRMYNLDSDLSMATDHDGNNPQGKDQRDHVSGLARQVYDGPDDWHIPRELKTKDKLTFLWACTLFYKATKGKKYLDMGVLFADSALERQFTDWENPIEGVYGNFYAFEGDDEKFTLEWNQNGAYHMGNIEPTNLKGYMELIQYLPDHENCVKWYNVIRIYGENYLKKTAKLSPFGIMPLTVYSNREYGGVKYFQVTNHGATGMYGQVAKNMMEMARFLSDPEYQILACNNLQFVAGLNPGMPTTYGEGKWEAKSLIQGLGANSFEAKHGAIGVILSLKKAPLGSGVNGFSADVQFRPTDLGTVPDAPKGILNMNGLHQYNEDYLPHSQGYVSGACHLEKEPRVRVRTRMFNRPVSCLVNVDDRVLNCNGELLIEGLAALKEVEITAEHGGMSLGERFPVINGMDREIVFDFGDAISLALTVPEIVGAGDNRGRAVIKNLTKNTVEGTLVLSSHGVDMESAPEKMSLGPLEEIEYSFNIRPGYRVMPYMVRGVFKTALNMYTALGEGKVPSAALREPESYVVNIRTSSGGDVSPGGEITVGEGSTLTLIICPRKGYFIGDVIEDGVSMGSMSSHVMADIREDHDIFVRFCPQGP